MRTLLLPLLRSYCSYVVWTVLGCSYSSYADPVTTSPILRQTDPVCQDFETNHDHAYIVDGGLPVLYSYEVPCSYSTVTTRIPPNPFPGGAAHGW